MRRALVWLILMLSVLPGFSSHAATGRVMKVLPLFLDQKGRESLSPSLYERDAYQAQLRQFPKRRGGMRFAVQWKARPPVWEPLKLRVQLRGVVQGDVPKQMALETPVQTTGWFGKWITLTLSADEYKTFGEVTAWRVTLWEGDQMLGEQKSFLW